MPAQRTCAAQTNGLANELTPVTRVQMAATGKQGTRTPAVVIKDMCNMTPSKGFTDLAICNQDAVKETQGNCALKQAKGFGDESQSV